MHYQVGFGRQPAMPETVMPLGGVGLVGREYTGVHSTLYITCVAITDSTGRTVLLYTQDFLKSGEYVLPIRQAVSQAAQIPLEDIMFASTHTHAAPAVYYDKAPGVFAYREICTQAAVKAARDALADREEGHLTFGRTRAEGLAFSRHYVMADGTVKKTPGKKACPVAHADPADDEMQLIRFARSGKKDILLMSFNVHPTFLGQFKHKLISSDVPGAVRSYLEPRADCLVAYFTGAAGNQTGNSQVAATDHGLDLDGYGAALGKLALEALPRLKPAQEAPIKVKNLTFTGRSNKERIELKKEADEIVGIYGIQGEEATKPLLEKYGIASAWEAYAIRRRYDAPQTLDMPLAALSLGELSFVFAPYEMFGPTAVHIKENTPFGMTFVVTCTNESHGYLPTKKAFTYDVYEKLVTNFAPGTAETLADTFLTMLHDLKV